MFLLSPSSTILFSPNNIDQKKKGGQKIILLSKKYNRLRFYHSLKIQVAYSYIF